MKIALLSATVILCLLTSLPFSIARPAPQESRSGLVLSTIEQIQEDFREVPCRQKDRQAGVRAVFAKMGAPAEALSVEKFGGVENLVLRRNAASHEIIVIGAHYDLIERGCGAIDNWSGIVTLAHLYRSIQTLPSQKTVVFVAFGREEEGLIGSRAMVKAIPKDELSSYCAMINIDSFGLAKPFALENASTSSLMTLAKTRAEILKVPFYTVPLTGGDSDSSSFAARDIPAVTLSGLSNEWRSILHSSKDQPNMVNPTSVYLGYRLALAMWNAIDAEPCGTYRSRNMKPTLSR